MISKIEEQKNKFGVCTKCKAPRSNFNWCSICDCEQLVLNFKNWTSGNDELDKFIQYTQNMAKSYLSYLEWIPYERLENINYVGSGCLSNVYSAIWKDGERIDDYWDDENDRTHKRSKQIPVALKYHNDYDGESGFNIMMKILTDNHRCVSNCDASRFIRHYGVSKDPRNDTFIIVMQYANDGNLEEFLIKSRIEHDWQWKLNILRYLAQDLSTIHNAGLAHRDVRNQNVFIRGDNWAYLGQLYWSMTEEELNGKRRFIYEKLNDIHRFGELIMQIATETNFYIGVSKIDDLPKPIIKLIKSCINDDVKKRPDINKVLYILEKWCGNPQHFDD